MDATSVGKRTRGTHWRADLRLQRRTQRRRVRRLCVNERVERTKNEDYDDLLHANVHILRQQPRSATHFDDQDENEARKIEFFVAGRVFPPDIPLPKAAHVPRRRIIKGIACAFVARVGVGAIVTVSNNVRKLREIPALCNPLVPAARALRAELARHTTVVHFAFTDAKISLQRRVGRCCPRKIRMPLILAQRLECADRVAGGVYDAVMPWPGLVCETVTVQIVGKPDVTLAAPFERKVGHAAVAVDVGCGTGAPATT